MKIDHTKYIGPFEARTLPKWTCSTCGIGYLEYDKIEIEPIETQESKQDQFNPDSTYEWYRGIFTDKLICNNKSCGETVVFSGKVHLQLYTWADEHDDYSEFVYQLYPEYFSLPIHIITLHKQYPETAKKQLLDAFTLYWHDLASCANKIRVAVEMVMNNKKVKRYDRTKRGLKPVSLHKRIELYAKKNAEACQYLEAVKWIGNEGSHASDLKLNHHDILTAFEMLNQALELIYADHKKQLKRIATAINKNKGIKRPKPAF